MPDSLHYERWVERFAREDPAEAHAMAERVTALRVLRAFVNEAVLASEGTAGLLCLGEDLPGTVAVPGAFTFLLSLPGQEALTILVASQDACGELSSIHALYELEGGTIRPLSPTVASICDRLGIPEPKRGGLHSNVRISVEAARRWHTRPRPGPDLDEIDRDAAYLHFEQACNLIRSTINPAPYSFVGRHAYHPLLEQGSALHVPLFRSGGGQLEHEVALEEHAESDAVASVIGSEVLLPIHPQYLEHLRAHRSSLLGDLLPGGSLRLHPTSSIRTMLRAGRTSFHVKCSYAGQITSRPRFLYRPEAVNAMRTTRLLQRVEDAGLWPESLHVLPDLAMVGHREDEALFALVRGGLDDARPRLEPDDLLIPSFSLLSPRAGTPERLLDELVRRSGLCAEAYFDELAERLVHGHLGLAALGITHESHAQNTLFVCNRRTWRIRALCLRDLESSKINKGMLHAHGLEAEHVNSPDARRTRSMVVLEEGDRAALRYFFTYHYCLLIESQLVPIADHLTSHHAVAPGRLAERCQAIFAQWWADGGVSFGEYARVMEPTSVRRNVLSVGLGLGITTVPNRRLPRPHPFYPGYPRMMRTLGG